MANKQDAAHPIRLPSAAMQAVYSKVEQFACTEVPILITGETGVGKEIIAREIYRMSDRHGKPLIITNCSTVPDNGLLHSRIFGHEKGAFTGATHQRKGLFEEANTGTLFLDEIGDMSLEVQPKFLRVLENQEFSRLGGNKVVKTDVRIIAATNKDLKSGIEDKTFREDLYYRLSTFDIDIPPLREHPEDIPSLVAFFLSKFSAKHHKTVVKVSPEALNVLERATWPGNIRQLKQTMEKAVLLTQTDEITFSDLPSDIVIPSEAKSFEKASEDLAPDFTMPAEMYQILAQISVKEFVLIFGGVPKELWWRLPEKVQQSVIAEASFHLSVLLDGQKDVISIKGMDRNQILGTAAQYRVKECGSIVKAADSLGVDPRTVRAYMDMGDVTDRSANRSDKRKS